MRALLAEAARRRATAGLGGHTGVVRSAWADELPQRGQDHELPEGQMQFLLGLHPAVGLLGGAHTFSVLHVVGKQPRFLWTSGQHEHPAASLQAVAHTFLRARSACHCVLLGVHPVTELGTHGLGHWVALLANKVDGASTQRKGCPIQLTYFVACRCFIGGLIAQGTQQ